MTDRDRLIELVDKAKEEYANDITDHTETDYIVECLFNNGVIVLPCKKGAVLNRNGEKCIVNHWNIILTAFNEENQVRLFDVKEVERALKERIDNG